MVIGRDGLILKKWKKNFRLEKENLDLIPTWSNFLNLLIEYLNINII